MVVYKNIFKDCLFSNAKVWSPSEASPWLVLGPILLPQSWFKQTWICVTEGCLHINMSKYSPVVLERKMFLLNLYIKLWSRIVHVGLAPSRGYDLNKPKSALPNNVSKLITNHGPAILKKSFFKQILSYIFYVKFWSPIATPPYHQELRFAQPWICTA